jgi:hypothetical protein
LQAKEVDVLPAAFSDLKDSIHDLMEAETAATKVREEAADAKYAGMIADVVESTNKQAETTKSEFEDLKEGVVADTSAKLAVVETELTAAIAALEGKVDGDVETALDGVTKRADLAETCAARGGNMAVVSGKCIPITQAVASAKCDKDALGATRYESVKGKLQLCMQDGPSVTVKGSFAWESLAVQGKAGATEGYPAKNGAEILQDQPSAKSGMYWIKPEGDAGAVKTYCDMSSDYKGYCLASYGHNCGTSCSSCNKLMINMNNPNGENWNPVSAVWCWLPYTCTTRSSFSFSSFNSLLDLLSFAKYQKYQHLSLSSIFVSFVVGIRQCLFTFVLHCARFIFVGKTRK